MFVVLTWLPWTNRALSRAISARSSRISLTLASSLMVGLLMMFLARLA